VSLQLSSEQSVGDVSIAQRARKKVPQARSSGCKSSVVLTLLSVRGTTQVWTSADGRDHRMLSDTRQQSSAKWRRACPGSKAIGTKPQTPTTF